MQIRTERRNTKTSQVKTLSDLSHHGGLTRGQIPATQLLVGAAAEKARTVLSVGENETYKNEMNTHCCIGRENVREPENVRD